MRFTVSIMLWMGLQSDAMCVKVCTANAFSVEPWLGVHERCNDPSFWCKNEETANECGVYEYCKIGWEKNNHQKETAANVRAKPVKITLYYESYCPGCSDFITTQWYPTYIKLKGTGILELELVPFGNTKVFWYVVDSESISMCCNSFVMNKIRPCREQNIARMIISKCE